MALKCEDYSQVCVLTPDGDFAGDQNAVLRKQATERIDAKRIVDFVVDMERTDFIDSEGLETLLWLKRRCEDLFGKIKLANVRENVHKILEITRLEHRFECADDLASALKTMR